MTKKHTGNGILITIFILISVLFFDTVIGYAISLAKIGGGSQNTSTSLWTAVASTPTEGSGSAQSPYMISTPQQLAWVARQVNTGTLTSVTYVTLADNIDLQGRTWEPIGNSSHYSQIYFDGNGKVIKNMVVSGTTYSGLFGYTTNPILNVTISNAEVSGSDHVGAIAGYSTGRIENCNVQSGVVKGSGKNIGGIVGWTISNIENCINSATVFGSTTSSTVLGGIAGLSSSNMIGCFNYGTVINYGSTTGGICGTSNGVIENCMNEGLINASSTVGGIVGNTTKEVSSSGSSCEIIASTPSSLGSIAGTGSGKLVNCFGIADVYAQSTTGVQEYGAPNSMNGTSTYSYTRTNGTNDLKRYKLASNESISNSFSSTNWTWEEDINGGLPFPRTLFSIGETSAHSGSMSRLRSMGFTREITYNIANYIQTDENGFEYIELGYFPQTIMEEGTYDSSDILGYMTFAKDFATYDEANTWAIVSADTETGLGVTIGDFYAYSDDVSLSNGMTVSEWWDMLDGKDFPCFAVEPIRWYILEDMYDTDYKREDTVVLASQPLFAGATEYDEDYVRNMLSAFTYECIYQFGNDELGTLLESNNEILEHLIYKVPEEIFFEAETILAMDIFTKTYDKETEAWNTLTKITDFALFSGGSKEDMPFLNGTYPAGFACAFDMCYWAALSGSSGMIDAQYANVSLAIECEIEHSFYE